jgi:hypothetical protein
LQLSKKTKELNKACEKHYQLEQELAFYKIDSKFDSLGKSPPRFHNDVRKILHQNYWSMDISKSFEYYVIDRRKSKVWIYYVGK